MEAVTFQLNRDGDEKIALCAYFPALVPVIVPVPFGGNTI